MIIFEAYQDSLGDWHVAINSDGNTIATLPVAGYGYETETQAKEAAKRWINSRRHLDLDIEGGGVRHIRPHKGGRTIKRSTDVTPETNERLRVLAKHGISLGDLVEEAAAAKYAEVVD